MEITLHYYFMHIFVVFTRRIKIPCVMAEVSVLCKCKQKSMETLTAQCVGLWIECPQAHFNRYLTCRCPCWDTYRFTTSTVNFRQTPWPHKHSNHDWQRMHGHGNRERDNYTEPPGGRIYNLQRFCCTQANLQRLMVKGRQTKWKKRKFSLFDIFYRDHVQEY